MLRKEWAMKLRMTAAAAALIGLVLVTIFVPAAKRDDGGIEVETLEDEPIELALAPPPEDGPRRSDDIREVARFVQPVAGSTTVPALRLPAPLPAPALHVGSAVRPRPGVNIAAPAEAGNTIRPRLPAQVQPHAQAGSVAGIRRPVAAPRPAVPQAGSVIRRGGLPLAFNPLSGGLAGRPGTESTLRRFVAFGPGGLELANGDANGEVRLFDLQSLQLRRAMKLPAGGLLDMLYTPDGALLTSSTDGRLRLFDTASGAVARSYDAGSILVSVALVPGGEDVIAGSQDGRVIRLSLTTGKSVELGRHPLAVQAVAVSPDGRFAVSAGIDPDLRLWKLDSEAPSVALFRGGRTAFCLAFSHDGRWLASAGSGSTTMVWKLDPVTAPTLEKSVTGIQNANGLIFDRSSRRLFVSGKSASVNISRVDLETGTVSAFTNSIPPESIRDMTLSPDGLMLAAVRSNNAIHLFQLDPTTSAIVGTNMIPPTSGP